MKITKNKNGTFNLTEVSEGKLLAIVHAIDKLHEKHSISAVQADVRSIIKTSL